MDNERSKRGSVATIFDIVCSLTGAFALLGLIGGLFIGNFKMAGVCVVPAAAAFCFLARGIFDRN